MIVIDAERCRHELAFDRLVPALAEGFVRGCQMPPRHVHQVGAGDSRGEGGGEGRGDGRGEGGDEGGTVLIMPAWTVGDGGLLGIKIVNVFPGNAKRGLPGLHATYTLFDATTGRPLAALDGDVVTVRRTAATAALGASRLLPTRHLHGAPVDLCVVGSGRVARWLPWAFAAVVPLGEVRVWNHRHEGALGLARCWQDEGLPAGAITAVEDLAPAVRASGLVSCATLASEPLIRAEWLRPDSHLDLIGSFAPTLREATPPSFAEADVWIDIPEATTKAGDLLDAFAAGALRREDISGDLPTLLARSGPDATSLHRDGRRTVFKSVGSATADLIAATLIWQGVHDQAAPEHSFVG